MLPRAWSVFSDKHFAITVVLAAVTRIWLGFTYEPWWVGDTIGYTAAGYNLLVKPELVDFVRPPIYPLFMAGIASLFEGSIQLRPQQVSAFAITIAQQLLGVIGAAIFYLTLKMCRLNKWIVVAVSVLFATYLPLARYDNILLTESLTTFLNVCILFFIAHAIYREPRASLLFVTAALGATAALATLTRPNEIILQGIAIVAVTWRLIMSSREHRSSIPLFAAVLLVITSLGPVGAWSSWNYIQTGRLAVTNFGGISLTHAVYNLFDKVEVHDSLVGKIMHETYQTTNTDGAIKKDYVWTAWPRLAEVRSSFPFYSGLPNRTGIDLDRYLGVVSRNLVKRFPLEYAENAMASMSDALNVEYILPGPTLRGDPETVDGRPVLKNEEFQSIQKKLADAQGILYQGAVIAALALPILLLTALRQSFNRLLNLGTIGAFCLASLLATLMAYSFLATYYPRYGIPYVPLIFTACAISCSLLLNMISRKRCA